MDIPNKLSLKKKHRRAPIAPPGDCIVITDSDEEKENNDKVGKAGSFRTKYRTPRRDSTILAGNLTLLDQSQAPELQNNTNVTVRRSRGKEAIGSQANSRAGPLQNTVRLSCASVMTEDLTIPHRRQSEDKFVSPKSTQSQATGAAPVTEDESDFYSCQGSPPNPMNQGMQDTWMTDITTKSQLDKKTVKPVPPAPAVFQTPDGRSIFKKPQGSTTVKAATFFSVEKRRTLVQGQNAILAGGSDSDSSPEKKIQPARLDFTGKMERTVVVPSDEELTEDEDIPVANGVDVGRPRLASDSDDDVPLVQLGRDFLSDTQFGKIVDWVQHSPFSSKLELSRTVSPGYGDGDCPTVSDEEVDSLLKSSPEDGQVRPSWAAPLPELSINTSRGRGSCGDRTSKAGGSWNKTSSEVTRTSRDGASEMTSKAGGSWNITNSERTSKAGGSWHNTNSERIKAGGSWHNTNSERTSKGGGSWNQSNSERTNKVGGSFANSENSKRTSKAEGSWNQALSEATVGGSELTSNHPTSTSNSQSPFNAGDSRNKYDIGAERENRPRDDEVDLDGTLEDFDKLRLGGRGKHEKTDSEDTSNLVTSKAVQGKSISRPRNGSSKAAKKVLSTQSSNYPISSPAPVGTKSSKISSTNQSKSATPSSFHLHLSLSVSDRADPVLTNKSLNLDGALTNSKSSSDPLEQPNQACSVQNNGSILQSSYVKAPPTTSKPKLPPIENSVNAVRCWTQDTPSRPKPDSDDVKDVWGQLSVGSQEPQSQVSEGVEKCNNKGKGSGDSDSEEDLEKFLTNLKSKKKPIPTVESSDSDKNFVVPDDEIDSDEFNTPKMNLKDRIMKRNKPDISSHRKPRVPSPISDSDGSLPDIDRKGSTTPEAGARDKTNPVSKPRPGRSVKKPHIIYSDSDDEDAPVHEISSDNDDSDHEFHNIYEPGSYHLVQPPSTPIVIPPTEKKTKPRAKKKPKDPIISSDKTPKSSQVYQDQNFSAPTLTFLSSLTLDTPINRCHPSALPYLKNFNKQKTELASRLFALYNTQIFESALPEEFEISWNVRLTKTAGLCYSRRHRNRHNIEVRSSRIELSTKVIDSGDRLRDTLIHEMCHAASWIISGYRDGHGPLWRTWAEKAMQRFPELPVIDRCHSYQIRTKYTYRCEKCGYSIGRHSKSLDTEKKVCGHCYGKFQLVVNGKTVQTKQSDTGPGGGNSAGAAKPKAPNAFALFVKENYKVYKLPGVKHGDVMKTLSAKFSETKIGK